MSAVRTRMPGIGNASNPFRAHFLGLPFDLVDSDAVVALISARPPERPLEYVVTPNVDHIVKASQDEGIKPLYAAAWLSLCDSKPILLLSHIRGVGLFHVTGSDLTVRIFHEVAKPGDAIALIVASEDIASEMKRAFPELDIRTHVPPMGVLHDTAAFQACKDFVTGNWARFVFIGIGAPQSETIAYALSQDPAASGIAFCIGASLEFMLGLKQRAPGWMQAMSLEWLHRLASEPGRLWRRYLLGFIPLARLFLADFRQSHRHRDGQ